jgi:hypothetical protein
LFESTNIKPFYAPSHILGIILLLLLLLLVFNVNVEGGSH